MNTRQRHELRLLAKSGEFDLEQVASDFGVSVRSIRYDIDVINRLLGDLAREDAVVVRQKLAHLGDDVPRWQVMAFASTGERDLVAHPLTASERVLLSVFTLCWCDGFVTIQALADDYCVSRITVGRDLPRIREYCEENGLELVSNRGRGLRVVADEKGRRRVIAKVVRDFGAISGRHSGPEVTDYLNWFSEDELGRIAAIVRAAERSYDLYLDDVSFEAVVVHVALSIKRHERGTCLSGQAPAVREGDSSLQFRMASFIVDGVDEEFGIRLPDEECLYIGVHIGARSSEVVSSGEGPDAVLEFLCIAAIAEVSRELGRDLTHDAHLYRRLVQHVAGCVYRKRAGLLLENPLRDELLADYSEHAGMVRLALERSGLSRYIDLTDDEVAYVLLHFEAALVARPGEGGCHANVVVVCSTGVGTAELLSAELQRCFDVNVVASVPSHQARALMEDSGIDLVVTTVPLDLDVPCVEVRPLLREDDVARVTDALRALGFSDDAGLPPLHSLSRVARDVVRIVKDHPSRAEEGPLVEELRGYLSGAVGPGRDKSQNKRRKEGSHMLSELLEGGHVALDVECETWQEAVRASGAPLVATGDITEEYVDAVIENIDEAGPYVVITKGVALPHATNKVGVNRTAMSCVRLSHPVVFGSRENDPVKYEFMLATVDSTSHIQALMCLVSLLRSDEFRDVLEGAESEGEVVEFVREYERAHEDKLGGGE